MTVITVMASKVKKRIMRSKEKETRTTILTECMGSENKRGLYVLFTILIVCSAYIVFDPLFYGSKFVCGNIYSVYKGTKGAVFVHYKFKIGNKEFFGNEFRATIKSGISEDRLFRMKCVRIECSWISNDINRINDPRLIPK